LDRFLSDISQDRISAAERHHRHGGEEGRDLAEDIVGAKRDQEDDDRCQPEQEP
jgi:hypothetical protein